MSPNLRMSLKKTTKRFFERSLKKTTNENLGRSHKKTKKVSDKQVSWFFLNLVVFFFPSLTALIQFIRKQICVR